MNATVEKAVSQGIAEYEPYREQLGELKAANDKAVFDYHDKNGNKEARSHVYKLKQTRSAVEGVRKEAKAESLARGRKIDAEANEIKDAITAMIEVHAKPLQEIEDADLARIAAHRARIAEIEELGEDVSNMDYTAEQLGNRVRALKEQYPINDSWEEFELQAARAKEKANASLASQIERRKKYEADQAELERLRLEAEANAAAEKKRQEEKAQAEREARIAQEAADKAKADAEAKAQAERDAAEKERLAAKQAAIAEREAAEKRELELKLEAERAESARKDAENRAALAQQNAEREHQEKLRRAEEAAKRREADIEHRRTINCKAKAALVKGGLSDEHAELAIRLIAEGQVPAVAITY